MTEQEKKVLQKALESLRNLASDLGKLEDEVPSIAELQSIVDTQPIPFDDPLFWYRPRSDGYYEGPIHNAQIDKVRRESGAWHPLYTRPWSAKNWMPIELFGVAEILKEGGGFWRACTGCHELNEGHDTGPFSKVFECALGNGCDECGGIGAIWDATDYEDMACTMLAAAPEQPAAPEGINEFIADLQRSRTKYPKNGRMFDGLMGEVDELRRAYSGDGDIRAEAFDVAVCAYRIATEGDAGGNELLSQPAAQWVGLTDKQIESLWDHGMYVHCSGITALRAITHAIEAKLREKNGGKA